VFCRLNSYCAMVATVVWPANHIFLVVDSVTPMRAKTSDNAGRLPNPLAEIGESCGAMGLPGFHAALVQTVDVGDQALQGTCNLFGPLTVATITQSKKPTSLRMRPVSAPNNWKAARYLQLDRREILDLPSITPKRDRQPNL
jgi:hypothetical protein